MLSEMEEEQVEDGDSPGEDLLFRRDSKLEQSTTERIPNRIDELPAMHKCLSRVLEARVNQVETKKYFPDIVYIVQLPI